MRFIYTKSFVGFFIGLCILVFLVFLDTRGGLDSIKKFFLTFPGPLSKVFQKTGSSTKDFFLTLYNLKGVAVENFELKAKVKGLEAALAGLEADRLDNEILRKELGFVKNTKMNLVPCQVIAFDSLSVSDTATLDCGSNQGLNEGAVVVAQGFVVGKLIYVSKSVSTVLLARSSKFSLDVKLSKTGQSGIAKGSFNSGLVLDQIPQSAEAENGWLVVTAGIDPKVPKDIPVGEVGKVISNENELFKKTSLVMPVDFNRLQFVFVAK